MRTKHVTACAMVAAGPALAAAQPVTGLFEWQVSGDGSATWSNAITLSLGDPYRIRAVASWTDGPAPSIGFAGATFEQIDLIGADSSDVFGGASGEGSVPTYLTRLQANPENWTLQTGTGASAIGLKLDNINPISRINFGQFPKTPTHFPNPDFIEDNPIIVFMLDAIAGDPKSLTISSTWTRLGTPATNELHIYTSESGANKKPMQEAVRTDAVVTIIPAPAALAAFAMFPLARQRRRGG